MTPGAAFTVTLPSFTSMVPAAAGALAGSTMSLIGSGLVYTAALRPNLSGGSEMAREIDVSRRAFLAGVAGVAASTRFAWAAASDSDVPSISKRVEKLYKIEGSTQP